MNVKHIHFMKDTLLFGLGSFIPKLLTLLIVPLFTSCLSTVEFGTADLIINTASLALALFTFNISEAVLRYTIEEKSIKEQIFQAAFSVFLLGSGALVIIILMIFVFIPTAKAELLLLFAATYFSLGLNSLISAYCRGCDRVFRLVQSQIFSSVITLGCTLLFLLEFNWGLTGYLSAIILGNCFASLYCFLYLDWRKLLSFSYSHDILRAMLRYSIPLIFSTIAWWLTSVADRWILNCYHGTSAVGLYAIAFKIPAIFTAVQSILSQAWRLSVLRQFNPQDNDTFIVSAYHAIVSLLTVFCSALLLFLVPLAKLLYSNDFYEAWKYSPILLFSLLFTSFSLLLEDIFRGLKNTRLISSTLCFGTLISLFLNLLLIPYFGIYAAAFSSLLSSVAILTVRYLLLQKYLHLTWNRKIIFAILILSMQVILSCFGAKTILPQTMLFLLIAWIFYPDFKSHLSHLLHKV